MERVYLCATTDITVFGADTDIVLNRHLPACVEGHVDQHQVKVSQKCIYYHSPPRSFRCSNSSISHRWPSGFGVSYRKVFSAESPEVPAPTMATRLTSSVGMEDLEVKGWLERHGVR